MAAYRIYASIADEYGNSEVQRVGRCYGDVHKAIEACRKASTRYGVAELRDEVRSIYDRILAVYRNGRETHSRLNF